MRLYACIWACDPDELRGDSATEGRFGRERAAASILSGQPLETYS
jgi:hypothetical protein